VSGGTEPTEGDPSGAIGTSSGHVERALETSPALVAVTLGAEQVLVYQNRASRTIFGKREFGLPMSEAFPETSEATVARMREVLVSGAPVEVPQRNVRVRSPDGTVVVLRYVLAPFGQVGLPPEGVVITALDVTAEVRAEEAAVRARLLDELSARVTAADDPTSALQAVTDALVPGLADLAAVYVVAQAQQEGPDSQPIPPQVMTVAEELHPLGPPPPAAPRTRPAPWEDSMRAGEPLVLPVNDVSMPVVAPDPASARWLSAARAHSIAVAPLVVAGEVVGALLLLAVGDRPAYEEGDLPLLVDVAARAGAAVGRVATQRRQQEVALGLQRALLPTAPTALPGAAVAARYIAGAPGVEVGGDWWDVQDLGDGRIAMGIGDVSGRGVAAAAVMGQARAAMHAAGRAGLDPAGVLSLLDGLLHDVIASGRLSEPASPQFATACFGILEPAEGRLRISNAGHLPVLVRPAAGGVRCVELAPATPLGLLVGRYAETSVPVEPGDTIVLFTDGLVEIHDQDLDDGIGLLADTLERLGGRSSLESLADGLIETMGARAGYGNDDVALLILRVADRPDTSHLR
jgi:PAS domain S-box-containing protein